EAACMVFTDFRQTAESGVLVRAPDVRSLADKMRLPAEELAAEVDRAKASARGLAPDRFGRRHFASELQPPYVAVKVVPALLHTQGGLVVDGQARVLRPDGSPREGLCPAGGAAMGISGHGAAGYLAGNGLLSAL